MQRATIGLLSPYCMSQSSKYPLNIYSFYQFCSLRVLTNTDIQKLYPRVVFSSDQLVRDFSVYWMHSHQIGRNPGTTCFFPPVDTCSSETPSPNRQACCALESHTHHSTVLAAHDDVIFSLIYRLGIARESGVSSRHALLSPWSSLPTGGGCCSYGSIQMFLIQVLLS